MGTHDDTHSKRIDGSPIDALESTNDGVTRTLSFRDGNENILDRHRVSIEVLEVETTIPAGLKQGWMSGTHDDGRELQVTSGAGCGSKWGTIEVGERGFAFDATELLGELITVIDRVPPPVPVFEAMTSPLYASNDGQLTISDEDDGYAVRRSAGDFELLLFTYNRPLADAYIAGYDEARCDDESS